PDESAAQLDATDDRLAGLVDVFWFSVGDARQRRPHDLDAREDVSLLFVEHLPPPRRVGGFPFVSAPLPCPLSGELAHPQPVGGLDDRAIVDARVHARDVLRNLYALAVENRAARRLDRLLPRERLGRTLCPLPAVDPLQLRRAQYKHRR